MGTSLSDGRSRDWMVRVFTVCRGDTRPSWGTTFQGDEEAARKEYERCAAQYERAQLLHRPAPRFAVVEDSRPQEPR